MSKPEITIEDGSTVVAMMDMTFHSFGMVASGDDEGEIVMRCQNQCVSLSDGLFWSGESVVPVRMFKPGTVIKIVVR